MSNFSSQQQTKSQSSQLGEVNPNSNPSVQSPLAFHQSSAALSQSQPQPQSQSQSQSQSHPLPHRQQQNANQLSSNRSISITGSSNSISSSSSSSSPSSIFVSRVMSLILWSDPLTTCLTFVSGLLVFGLIQFGQYTLLTLISYVLLLQLLVCFIFINSTKLLSAIRGTPTVSSSSSLPSSSLAVNGGSAVGANYISSLAVHASAIGASPTPHVPQYLSHDSFLHYASSSINTINTAIHAFVRVVKCEDNAVTLKWMGLLLCLSGVGRIVDGMGVLVLTWIGLFVGVRLYFNHQQLVDERVSMISAMLEKVLRNFLNKIPGLGMTKSKEE